MLISEALAKPFDRRMTRKFQESVRAARYQMHPFVFDDGASEVVGKFAIDCPDLVIGHRQFALPPYPVTYIELKQPFFNAMPPSTAPDPDVGLAYLFYGNKVAMFARSNDTDAGLMPLSYTLLPPGQSKAQPWYLDGRPMDLEILLAIALGTGLFAVDDDATRVDIGNSVGMHWEGAQRLPTAKALYDIITSTIGDIRNMWAALLWLNIPSKYTRRQPVPASRGMRRGRPINYAAHNIVTIALGRTRTVRKAFLLAAPRVPPRRHEVRGNWHHHGGQLEGCGHEWPLLPDDDHVYSCARCGRRRWWVQPHQRGDASRGFVTKDYQVQP
jgi:hypothetical protein